MKWETETSGDKHSRNAVNVTHSRETSIPGTPVQGQEKTSRVETSIPDPRPHEGGQEETSVLETQPKQPMYARDKRRQGHPHEGGRPYRSTSACIHSLLQHLIFIELAQEDLQASQHLNPIPFSATVLRPDATQPKKEICVERIS